LVFQFSDVLQFLFAARSNQAFECSIFEARDLVERTPVQSTKSAERAQRQFVARDLLENRYEVPDNDVLIQSSAVRAEARSSHSVR
jgi:hypothetical protein